MIERAQALWDWTQAQDLSLLALNLQYIARERGIAATLMGAATPEQIEADVAALQVEVPNHAWEELDEILA